MSEYKQSLVYRVDQLQNGDSLKVAVIRSLFNEDITKKLEAGAIDGLARGGFDAAKIRTVVVPGACEIPLAAQYLFENGFDAVVVVGCVIRGETTHYETVCNAVERGCMQVQLKFSRPIGFGVIMTENQSQAEDRSGGKHGNKGFDAAQAAVRLLQVRSEIKNSNWESINNIFSNKYSLPREFYDEPSSYSE